MKPITLKAHQSAARYHGIPESWDRGWSPLRNARNFGAKGRLPCPGSADAFAEIAHIHTEQPAETYILRKEIAR